MHKTLTILATLLWTIPILGQNGNQYIDASMPVYYTPGSFSVPPGPGDTIFIASDRTEGLIFRFLEGSIDEPIVIINDGGQVNINTTRHSAIDFRDCKHIKMTGRGSSAHHYGFKLDAFKCGVAFSGFSSHCEIEFVEIDHDGFFGIKAKKDFGGNPPLPISVFSHLIIHDNLIKNVTEGMYIGEYKTPAMEFKHLRVFNNVIQDTGREGIQITNASEDVAVYNNFIWNAGTDHKKFHGKSLQIGDNCVGRYYNNVMIGANEHSFIIFGSGDIEITNNYCSESEGGSIDNRKVSFEDAPIIVADNYFHDLTLNQVVRNRNEINYIELTDNEWHGGSPSMFYNNQSGAQQKSVLQNNTNVPVTIIANPDLSVPYPQFPAPYQDLGPQQGLSYTINYLPQLEIEEVHMIDWDQPDTLEFNAYVQDGDGIQYEFSGLPSFIQVELVGDGTARLIAQPATTDKGVYPIKVVVSDDSHNDKTRLSFDYIVKNPNNTAPQIQFSDNLQLLTLTKNNLSLPITDAEGDDLIVSVENLPPYMTLQEQNGVYNLVTDVKYRHAGSSHTIKIIADDRFGGIDSMETNVNVFHSQISAGTPVIRVNCGGPELADSDLTWEDAYHQITPFEITKTHRTGSHGWSGTNNTGAPDNLFGPFAREGFTGDQMFWSMPVDQGTYEVNLYFAERSSDINNKGPIVFDLMVNDNLALDSFSIYHEAGLTALKKTFTISVLPGESIDLEFIGIQNKPKINGIEIIYISGGNQAPVIPALDNLTVCTDFNQRLSIHATDADADPLTYLVTGLPSYATATYYMDSVVIEFTALPEHAGEGHMITVFAIDHLNTAAERELFAIVVDCNGNALAEENRGQATAESHRKNQMDVSNAFPVPSSVSAARLKAYPNPAAGWLSVNMTNETEGKYTIELVDVQGRVHEIAYTNLEGGQQTITITLNRNNLPAGYYSLRAISEEGLASAPQALILQ